MHSPYIRWLMAFGFLLFLLVLVYDKEDWIKNPNPDVHLHIIARKHAKNFWQKILEKLWTQDLQILIPIQRGPFFEVLLPSKLCYGHVGWVG